MMRKIHQKNCWFPMAAAGAAASHTNTTQITVEMMVKNGVDWKTGATVKAIEADGVVYADAEGEHKLPAGQVVSGFGYRAYNPLEDVARKVCDNVQVVGSAIKAGNALVAGKEAYAAGLAI